MTALAREELKGAEHPSALRLIAYHRGQIPPAEMETIREHLSLCQACTAIVLDAADFFAEDEEEEDEIAPSELAASWDELDAARRRTAASSRPAGPLRREPSSPRRSIFRSLGFAYGLAAILAAVSLGVLAIRETGFPPRPTANVGLYDMTSASSQRGERVVPTTIHFRSPDDLALLVLNPAVVPRSARYRVRVRNAIGTLVWSSESLVLQPSGAFHIGLPATAFPPGRYSLSLYGLTAGRETPLGSYPIVVER
jgi:hypothetical protein